MKYYVFENKDFDLNDYIYAKDFKEPVEYLFTYDKSNNIEEAIKQINDSNFGYVCLDNSWEDIKTYLLDNYYDGCENDIIILKEE